MRRITAFIRPYKLEDVKISLVNIGISGMTVSNVKGYGRQKGHFQHYRGSDYKINFIPKLKVEVIVEDEQLQLAVEKIIDAARMGEIGDGKILVSCVERAIRIRTREQDEEAL